MLEKALSKKPSSFGNKLVCAVFVAVFAFFPTLASAEEPPSSPPNKEAPEKEKKSPVKVYEGSMTIETMDTIIKRLDQNVVSPRRGMWQFTIENVAIIIVTDEKHNRMRIMSPVAQEKEVSEEILKRTMQANFDTALDARYALAQGFLWSTFIHPLQALHPRQFISGIGQTVNLAKTFGKTYSSGAMVFGGGDSRELIQKKLLDELQRKGLPI